MTNVEEKMDTRPVEVRIWNADYSKYTDKVLDQDEFNRFLAEREAMAEATPRSGRRQWVWFANMYVRDGYGVNSKLFSARYEFYTTPKMMTKSELTCEYHDGPINRNMFVVKAAC